MKIYIEKAQALNELVALPCELDAEAVQRCIEAISNLPGTDTLPPCWVSVEDKTPEAPADNSGDRRVDTLCHFDDGFIATATYDPDLDGWELWADAGEVTHWMPLPEPPQGY